MYRCDSCGVNVKFATKNEFFKAQKLKKPMEKLSNALTIVTETRPKNYKTKYKRGKKIITKESSGWEIKKEIKVCEKCYEKLQ